MSKVVTSPSKRFSGTVTLYEPLTLSQVELIEAAFGIPEIEKDGRLWFTVLDKLQIPAILACVETWNIPSLEPLPPTLDSFPMTPRKASHDFIAWLFDEIRQVYLGEVEIPNE